MKQQTVTIKFDELTYRPRLIEVPEDKADEIYNNLKERIDIRNLRRI